MRLIYSFSIFIYLFLIRFASFFNKKASLWIKGRKNNLNIIEKDLKGEKQLIWFHCSSLGEFEQARPVLEQLKKENDSKIFLSFFSPSGYEVRKNYEHADFVFYMPMDTNRQVKRFLTLVQPKMAIFVKYDFWYNYL
ncbi:MAG: 3-deoxy-D-manno-octulosonic acid transferase, partial [Bacteroidetes bacterium HGW-Bacteroidetes-12]